MTFSGSGHTLVGGTLIDVLAVVALLIGLLFIVLLAGVGINEINWRMRTRRHRRELKKKRWGKGGI